MANKFDFELTAKDQATESINRINEAVNNLIPKLDQTPEKLKLGGQQSIDGLLNINSQFDSLTKGARQSVQFIGDIVPPLKMVTGLAVGIGGAATAINSMKNNLVDFANNGYRIQTTAKNISMTTKAFQELTGAMVENGATREAAEGSVSSFFENANEVAHNRGDLSIKAILAKEGIGFSLTKENLVDVGKLITDLNGKFQNFTPGIQALIARKLGLSPEMLNYLRQSTTEVQRLKDQAQRDGLIFSEKDLQNAAAFRKQINQMSSSWDGMLMRSEAWMGQSQLIKDQVGQISDLMKNSFDRYSVAHFFSMGQNNESDYDRMRKASKDEGFKKTLTDIEKYQLNIGYESPELRKKIDARYIPAYRATDFASDVQALHVPGPVTVPPIDPVVDPNARSVRNNNPWNLNYARQAGATREQGVAEPRFARFPTPEAGILAADRQLQLYYSGKSEAAHYQPLQTLTDIISTASPRKDGNNTEGMISGASSELGLDKDAPLNLSDSTLRARVLAAIFRQEGNSRYTPGQIRQVISREESQTQYTDQQVAGAPQVQPSEPAKENSNGEGGKEQIPTIITGEKENINQQHQSANGSEQIAKAISDALKDNKTQIELTIVNSQTGEKKVVTVQGPKVAASLPFP
ncbi:hypothetical protein [Acerihabitans sp.]|uniref:hypothetical protein n=1 Tax=Acerihabitans sp. TaxID=2811394 RepID=UPI002ED8A6F2